MQKMIPFKDLLIQAFFLFVCDSSCVNLYVTIQANVVLTDIKWICSLPIHSTFCDTEGKISSSLSCSKTLIRKLEVQATFSSWRRNDETCSRDPVRVKILKNRLSWQRYKCYRELFLLQKVSLIFLSVRSSCRRTLKIMENYGVDTLYSPCPLPRGHRQCVINCTTSHRRSRKLSQFYWIYWISHLNHSYLGS